MKHVFHKKLPLPSLLVNTINILLSFIIICFVFYYFAVYRVLNSPKESLFELYANLCNVPVSGPETVVVRFFFLYLEDIIFFLFSLCILLIVFFKDQIKVEERTLTVFLAFFLFILTIVSWTTGDFRAFKNRPEKPVCYVVGKIIQK